MLKTGVGVHRLLVAVLELVQEMCIRDSTDVLHYRRIGKTQTAEIILNRGPHLIAELAFGKYAEVNPGGFTVLVEENHPEHVGYFSIY